MERKNQGKVEGNVSIKRRDMIGEMQMLAQRLGKVNRLAAQELANNAGDVRYQWRNNSPHRKKYATKISFLICVTICDVFKTHS